MLLSVLKQSPRYYSKNFYKQIGLSPHFTLKGFLLRLKRQYPTLYKCTKFTLIFLSVSTTSMLLIQGSALPFQAQVKSTTIKGIQRVGRMWYLNETNTKGSNIIAYINLVFSFIQYAFENEMQNSNTIPYYLSLINNSVENNIKNLKKSQRNSLAINQINYSVILLRKLLQALQETQSSVNRKNFAQILKQKSFLSQYRRIIDNTIAINMDENQNQIEEKYKIQFENIFLIFQYLLKFQDNQQKKVTLDQLITLLRQKRMRFMCQFLEKRGQSLKTELKKLYQNEKCYQSQILKIINIVEQNRVKTVEKYKQSQ